MVQFIQTPLVEALRDYYVQKAKDGLTAEYAGEVPPELDAMIDEESRIPTTLEVDPFSLLDGLSRDYPGLVGDWQIKRNMFVHNDVALVDTEAIAHQLLGQVQPVGALSRAIQDGKDGKPGGPERVVWDCAFGTGAGADRGPGGQFGDR